MEPPSGDPNTPTTSAAPEPTLLAIDLGLRCGLAVFSRQGHLLRYRSTHFPDVGTLKRALPRVLQEAPNLGVLVCEGDRHLASVWTHRLPPNTQTLWLAAEDWRVDLLTPSERRDGPTAKQTADTRAREVIAHAGLPRPKSLRHDAAEAILIGLWASLHLGWLETPPWRLPRR